MQELKLSVKGLYTFPSPLGAVPPGALKVADNIVIDREEQADSRRGFGQYGSPVTGAKQLLQYKTRLFLHTSTSLYRDSDDAGTWVALSGTYSDPDSIQKIQSVEQNQNLYMTLGEGLYKLQTISDTSATAAGALRALDIQGAISGAGNAVAAHSQVAYRVVLGRVDANNNLILGTPTARLLVANSTASDNQATLTMSVPREATTSDFYQVYRSLPSASETAEPDDELFLVMQRNFVAGDISSHAVTIVDDVGVDQLGATIYTAPSQDGILQSNFPPPLGKSLVEFQQYLILGNLKYKQFLNLTLTAQYTINQTLVLAGTTYIAKGAETIAAGEFKVGATIKETVDSLIRVINQYSTNTLVYAYRIDDSTFEVRARLFTTTAFTATFPALYSMPSPQTSTNSLGLNIITVSKFQQPEAWPLVNTFRVGSADKTILSMKSVRDAVFIEKEDGTYRLTGTSPDNFVIEKHDINVNIQGPNTCNVLNNQVYSMTNQGVAVVDVSGVATASRPIESTLLNIKQFANFAANAWGVGYDSDRKYLLGVPTTSLDTTVTQVFVYNYLTQSWTRWPMAWVDGLVKRVDDKLYVIDTTGQVAKERKAFDLSDYADYQYSGSTLVSHSGNTLIVDAVPAGVAVGFTILQDTNEAVITDISGTTLTINRDFLLWTDGDPVVFYQPISTAIEWIEDAAQNAGMLKHFVEVTYPFKDARFDSIMAKFATDFTGGFETAELEARGIGDWGMFSWGDVEWGGTVGGFQAIRTYVPREAARGHWISLRLELSQAFNALSLLGVSLIHEPMSSRFR